MGVFLKRHRNASTGAIATLDLTDAAAANRRFEVAAADGLSRSARFFGFKWRKSAAETVDVTISLVDAENGDAEYVIEGPTSDGGATTGAWYPPEGVEEVIGQEAGRPNASNLRYRLQFSQSGGACVVDPIAAYKEV